MLTIFTLSSGRSGTKFLAKFVEKNTLNCFATHEPYSLPFNPSLFGKPIYYNSLNIDEKLLPYLKRKQKRISNYNTSIYLEANHAFLKAAHRHAADIFD